MGAFDDLVPASGYAPSQAPASNTSVQTAPASGNLFDDLVPSDSGGDHPLTITPAPTASALPNGFASRAEREPDYSPDQMRDAQKEVYAGEAQQSRSGNYLDTLGRGVARAVPFMDDIAALGDTGASYLGLNTAPVGQASQDGMTFGQRYQDNLDRERAANQADDTDRTALSLSGQLGGALALPVGAAAKASGLIPRVAASSAVGGLYGGLYGFGQGDGLDDRLSRAKTGAELGAVGGVIAPAVIEAGGAALNTASKVGSIAGRFINPEAAAQNQVVSTLARDMKNGSSTLSPQDWAAAGNASQPVTVADAGGEATRALARSAANSSPEARQALQAATSERYADQSSRANDFLSGMFGGDLNSTSARDALQSQAAFINRNNYTAAYSAPNAQSMWNDEFQRLAQAPAVQSAIKDAQTMAGNRSVMSGEQKIANPFMVDSAGNLVPRVNPDGSTVTPSLRFWDQVQRSLRDTQQSAVRSGANEQGSVVGQLRSQLLGAMEDQKTGVPEFGTARAGAFKAFSAEDALTSGQNFARVTKAESITDQQAAFSKMSPPEKELFARGFASEIAQKAANAGESRNVTAMFDSQAFRDKSQMALGAQRASQLEAFLRVERSMNFLKNAVSGNSTTARQMLEMGLASGAGGAFEAYKEGHIGLGTVAAGVMGALLHKGYAGVNEKMAEHVGVMLASDNPDLVRRAVQQIATRPRMMDALRNSETNLSKIIAQRGAPKQEVPTSAPQGYKRGGSVSRTPSRDADTSMHAALAAAWGAKLSQGRSR